MSQEDTTNDIQEERSNRVLTQPMLVQQRDELIVYQSRVLRIANLHYVGAPGAPPQHPLTGKKMKIRDDLSEAERVASYVVSSDAPSRKRML